MASATVSTTVPPPPSSPGRDPSPPTVAAAWSTVGAGPPGGWCNCPLWARPRPPCPLFPKAFWLRPIRASDVCGARLLQPRGPPAADHGPSPRFRVGHGEPGETDRGVAHRPPDACPLRAPLLGQKRPQTRVADRDAGRGRRPGGAGARVAAEPPARVVAPVPRSSHRAGAQAAVIPTGASTAWTASSVRYGTGVPVTGSTMAMGGSDPMATPSTSTLKARSFAAGTAWAGRRQCRPVGVLSDQVRCAGFHVAPHPAAVKALSKAGTGIQLPSSRDPAKTTGAGRAATAAPGAAAAAIRTAAAATRFRQTRFTATPPSANLSYAAPRHASTRSQDGRSRPPPSRRPPGGPPPAPLAPAAPVRPRAAIGGEGRGALCQGPRPPRVSRAGSLNGRPRAARASGGDRGVRHPDPPADGRLAVWGCSVIPTRPPTHIDTRAKGRRVVAARRG